MQNLTINRGGNTKLIAYSASNDHEIGSLFLTINDTSAFPIEVLSDLQCVMADMGINHVGLLNILHVDTEQRGTGVGKELMQLYCDKIASHTDVDLVFARVENPQATGINIEAFYEQFGFESTFYAAGELLMATKGKADQIAEALTGLCSQRTKHHLHRTESDCSMEL